MKSLRIFTGAPLDCDKASFSSTKVYLSFDRIGYLLHNMHLQKSEGGSVPVEWYFRKGWGKLSWIDVFQRAF